MKAVYYIANNKDWGHVTALVWEALEEEGYLSETDGVTPDGFDIYRHADDKGNEFYFVPTDKAVCLNYTKYLPFMNERFGDADISGMVTWHEGAAAEPNVLTCHTLGDMNTGVYGQTRPRLMRNVMRGMRKRLAEVGLDGYRVVTEGTHWSGALQTEKGIEGECTDDPAQLLEYPVAMMDLEVGSDESSWGDAKACRALALSLLDIFDDDGAAVHNLLCIGGVHFDPNFAEATMTEWDGNAFGVTHILANQWLVSGEYENEEGFEKACRAVEAIEGGIEAVVMHDKAKGCYKNLARAIGEKYGVPVYKHQKLRAPETMELQSSPEA